MNILSTQYPLTSPSLHNALSQATKNTLKTSDVLSGPKRNPFVTSASSKTLPTEDASRVSSLLNQRVALETSSRVKRAASGYLQLGNGGVSGSLVGNVVDNVALVFNRSDTATFSAAISHVVNVTQAEAEITVPITLQLGNAGASDSIVGDVLDHGSLIFNRFGAVPFSGIIPDTGNIIQAGTATIAFDASLSGTGTFAGNIINSGTLSPGNNSPGSISINNDYTQDSNGKLLIRLAAPASYDQVMVGKKAQLSGFLQVEFLDGFVPNGNEEFIILTATEGVSGTFDAVDLGEAPFQVIYTPFDVKLKFIPASV